MTDLAGCLEDLCDSDDVRAEAAALALASLPPQQVLASLRDLLAAPDVDTRWWAVRALASISHPEAPGLLTQALLDADASVRQCAALGLRLHPDPMAVPALANALYDSDSLVTGLAADALAAIGAPAVPALLEVLQSGSRAARLPAVRALAAIGDTRSIPALFEALDEDSALVEYWASEGLERMGVGMSFFNPE
jgi:HEAT repeat protein